MKIRQALKLGYEKIHVYALGTLCAEHQSCSLETSVKSKVIIRKLVYEETINFSIMPEKIRFGLFLKGNFAL
jgi:hypothetical protein